MQELLNELSRRKKQAIAVLMDTLMLPFCLWIAFALRLGELSPEVLSFWPTFIVCVCVAIPLFGRLGLYRQVVRYMGNHAIRVMIVGCLLTTLAVAGMAFYEFSIRAPQDPIFPRSVPPIFFLLALLYVSGSRFAVLTYIQHLNEVRSREPVIIYGAGTEGVELARLLKQQEAYQPIAFVDENQRLQKRNIDEIYVYPPRALDKLLRDSKVKQVFIAISGDIEVRRRILEFWGSYPFACVLSQTFVNWLRAMRVWTTCEMSVSKISWVGMKSSLLHACFPGRLPTKTYW